MITSYGQLLRYQVAQISVIFVIHGLPGRVECVYVSSCFLYIHSISFLTFSRIARKGLCANGLLFEVRDVCYLYS